MTVAILGILFCASISCYAETEEKNYRETGKYGRTIVLKSKRVIVVKDYHVAGGSVIEITKNGHTNVKSFRPDTVPKRVVVNYRPRNKTKISFDPDGDEAQEFSVESPEDEDGDEVPSKPVVPSEAAAGPVSLAGYTNMTPANPWASYYQGQAAQFAAHLQAVAQELAANGAHLQAATQFTFHYYQARDWGEFFAVERIRQANQYFQKNTEQGFVYQIAHDCITGQMEKSTNPVYTEIMTSSYYHQKRIQELTEQGYSVSTICDYPKAQYGTAVIQYFK